MRYFHTLARGLVSSYLLISATLAGAGPQELELAWRTWMKEERASFSTLAIRMNGADFGAWGHQAEANAPLPLASLSKAVTGACIMALHAEGALDVEAPLRSVLADRPDLLPSAQSAGGNITVAQLLTHTSGLTPDSTQTLTHGAWWGLRDGHDPLARVALGRRLGSPDFYYNNENYAVLGSLIQEVTGDSIEEACAPRVLAGLETAAPSPQYGSTLAYAGWEMSVTDYARFIDSLRPTPDWPRAESMGGYVYGPGIEFVPSWYGGGFVHRGSYCLGARTGGSFFASLPNGLTFVLAHDLCLSEDQYSDLYDTLMNAARL